MVMDNATLESLGINGSDYWRQKSQNETLDKVDSTRLYSKADCIADIDIIQNIIDTSIDSEHKKIARVVKRILKYIKPELE